MLGTTEINNMEDIINSRSIVERINYLEIDEEAQDEEDRQELKTLCALVEEMEGYAGGDKAEDGIGLIRDSYFQDYAEQLAEDIGAIDSNTTWPLYHIDWEAAADSLKMDYSSLEFDGITYWYR